MILLGIIGGRRQGFAPVALIPQNRGRCIAKNVWKEISGEKGEEEEI